MELLKPVKDTLEVAKDLGGFVANRLIGGQWADIAPEAPQMASITFISTEKEAA